MKFSDGAWMWQKGLTPHLMRRISGYRVEGDLLYLIAVDRAGREGIDRVEGTALEIRVTSPMADVLRVRVRHHHPSDAHSLKFDLDYGLSAQRVEIEDRDDELVFRSGRAALRLKKSTWEMSFDGDGQPFTGAGHNSLGYMDYGDRGRFLSQRLTLGVGECIYGLGERFGPLVKNGQSVVIWNEDGGTVSDQAYKNIPFYLSSRGYGLLVNSPAKVEFEIATEFVSQVQFAVPGEELDYYVFFGPEPKDVLEKYTRLSGRPALPPAWSFGLWLSTSFTTKYNEQTVNEFVDGMAQRGIPLSVFHFDCFWMKERRWCDFEWDREAFPDPEGMLKRLHDKGLKVCVWINPYISQCSPLFEEGRTHGYFLKTKDGSVYQRDQWQPGMAFVDFSNSAAVAWYRGKLRGLLDMGVDSFKTDFGERIPDDAVYHSGVDPKLMHNYYAYLYNQAVFELLEEYHGKGNALLFARAGTAGAQKFPVHWGGDCWSNFESMAEDLRGGLSFCMSGAAFWSHDIGGFAGKANPSVYKRWVAFGLLSTHSRLHGSGSYRVPWLFDEESVEVMRHFTRLKNSLFPYLFAAAHDAHGKGWPVMRAMVLEYPDDPGCRYLDRQYMLGDALLVAPVFRQDDVAEFYLPEGRWTGLLDNDVVEGGRWVRQTMDFMRLPLFVRENALIPMNANVVRPSCDVADEITLHAFELMDGGSASTRVVAENGVTTRYTVRRTADRFVVSCDGPHRNVRFVLRSRWGSPQIANGRLLAELPEGLLVAWDDASKPLTIGTAPHAVAANGNGHGAGNGQHGAAGRPARSRVTR